tara:strand:+ start:3081 stop:4070 length:990 start_codon:yes stop_codon:yes gene_type:complete
MATQPAYVSSTSGAFGTAAKAISATEAATFIPEIWSDEIVASYEKNLVLANLVKKMTMQGKKGDTIHIPSPDRGAASSKTEGTLVNILHGTSTEVQVSINQHYEYSRLIDDIADVQALASLRQFYTEDAGYALALQVDTALHDLAKNFGDQGNASATDYIHSNSFFIDASNGLTAYAADTVVGGTDVFTDAGFRALIQKQDEANTPMDNRFLVLPPSARNSIMGIDRYVSSDFVSGQPVVNGLIGNLYGIDIYVSNNCQTVEASGDNSASSIDVKAGIFGHKDTMVLVEQLGVRTQTTYKQEYLATLMTADRLYGVEPLRSETGFVVVL